MSNFIINTETVKKSKKNSIIRHTVSKKSNLDFPPKFKKKKEGKIYLIFSA